MRFSEIGMFCRPNLLLYEDVTTEVQRLLRIVTLENGI